jgi:hypothetical protein
MPAIGQLARHGCGQRQVVCGVLTLALVLVWGVSVIGRDGGAATSLRNRYANLQRGAAEAAGACASPR